jgi:ATP-dependent RNA helicase DeaD
VREKCANAMRVTAGVAGRPEFQAMIDVPNRPVAGFAALGLDPALLGSLDALGYEEPTPIQRETIPPLLQGRDLLGQAATGTGKTAAFALPVLQLLPQERSGISALILVPTRELAMQVAEAVHRYGKPLGVQVLPIYGGQAFTHQLRGLRRGVDVVVATPGRALDHLRRKTLDLSKVRAVVLDEADEMLDMGFAEELEAILAQTPEIRQTALFSATMSPRIMAIAKRHLRDPVQVKIGRELPASGQPPRVRQVAFLVQRQHKSAALSRILDMENPSSAIVFCRTRIEVDELTETLNGRGYQAEALHGGLSQEQRDRVMRRFRAASTELLVATDVAARGLDIPHVSHVINYDVPCAPDAYVHRIGRTGRAGREGTAITLAEARERRMLRNIEQITKQPIRVEPVPTVMDLRARRLETTRASLRETLLSGDLDSYRVAVEALADEFDVMDIASAAVKLVDDAGGTRDNAEIPAVTTAAEPSRPAARKSKRPETARARSDRPGRNQGKQRTQDMARLYIGLGRRAGVRPQDLVGAIANEAGIDARGIGAIDIGDQFSILEVPGEAADDIIHALSRTKIRGKRVSVRRHGARD